MKIEFKLKRNIKGFTAVDLLVTLAAIAILAVVVLPAFGRSHSGGALAQCLNNLRQIGAAWSMYSDDSNGKLIESHPWLATSIGTRIAGVANPLSWAPGYAGLGFTATYGPFPLHSPTNTAGLKRSVFYPYLNDPALYRCPSDARTIEGLPVVRSYSMNQWMAGDGNDPVGRLAVNRSDILNPSQSWVLIDEDGLTIDDSMFVMRFNGRGFINLPGRRHSNGYTLLLADGHVVSRRLQDAVHISVRTPPGAPGIEGSEETADFQFLVNLTTNIWSPSQN